LNIDLRIDAWTMRPFIQDANHRNRVAVLNATGQIEFTGHGDDRLWLIFYDDSPRQGPASGHSDLDLILIREFNEIFNFTFPAAFTVFHISCDLDLTFKILDAVGEENQKPVGAGSVSIRSDEMIIQFNKGLLHLLLGYPEQPSHQDHKGKKDLCNQPSQFMGKKDVFPSQNRENEEQSSREHEKDQNGKDQSEEERKKGMDVS